MEKIKKIWRIFSIVAFAILLYHFRSLLIDNTIKLNEFSKKQELYQHKMDSLKIISEELVKNISIMDSKITSSKRAIDDLKKTPIVINYTNEEALQFLRNFAAKYNILFKDSL